jgi:hypothetical protein
MPDAAVMNGDLASIRAFVDKNNVKTGCKTTNVAINGNEVRGRLSAAGKGTSGRRRLRARASTP